MKLIITMEDDLIRLFREGEEKSTPLNKLTREECEVLRHVGSVCAPDLKEEHKNK